MEDQTTWKGHTFTLLVFTGIVVLCSIFFVLGMLVGRAQGQKLAGNPTPGATLKADAKSLSDAKPNDEKSDFTFYDSVKKEAPAVLTPAPKPEIVVADPPAKTIHATGAASSANAVHYQLGAFPKLAAAEKLLDQLKKKRFRAFILSPPEGDPNPFYRVQVGPFSDLLEAQDTKKKLESAGYQPILKK